MNVDVLNVRRLPARLNAEQVASLIGMPVSGIALLITARLLKPLGIPAQNSGKLFSAAELADKCRDSKWLDRATRCIENYNREKNLRAVQQGEVSSSAKTAA